MEWTMPSTSRVLPLRHTGYGVRLREIKCGCLKKSNGEFLKFSPDVTIFIL